MYASLEGEPKMWKLFSFFVETFLVPTEERRDRHRDAGLEVLLTEVHRGVGDHQGREGGDEGVHQLVGEVSPESIRE